MTYDQLHDELNEKWKEQTRNDILDLPWLRVLYDMYSWRLHNHKNVTSGTALTRGRPGEVGFCEECGIEIGVSSTRCAFHHRLKAVEISKMSRRLRELRELNTLE